MLYDRIKNLNTKEQMNIYKKIYKNIELLKEDGTDLNKNYIVAKFYLKRIVNRNKIGLVSKPLKEAIEAFYNKMQKNNINILEELDTIESNKKYSREAIEVSKAIKSYFNNIGITPSDFSISNFKADMDGVTLEVEKSDKTYMIDCLSLGIDEYINFAFVKEWKNINLKNLSNMDETQYSEIQKINKVIDSLLENINDDIYKSIVKEQLIDLSKKIEINKHTKLEDIYKYFSQASLELNKNNIIDNSVNCYSKNFYDTILTGKREVDSQQAEKFITKIAQKIEDKENISVGFFDLNLFKKINDEYGHDKGDKILQGLVSELKSQLGDEGTVIRRGGDEFIIIASKEKMQNIVKNELDIEHIKKRTEKFGLNPNEIPVSMSFGLVKINTEKFDSKNSSKNFKIADILCDHNLKFGKTLSHEKFGSSRGFEILDPDEIKKDREKFIFMLHQELDINNVKIYDKEFSIEDINKTEAKLAYHSDIYDSLKEKKIDVQEAFDLMFANSKQEYKLK